MAFADGSLLRLSNADDLWAVFDGRRCRVGSVQSNVLDVMQRLASDIQVVDQATLDSLPVAPLRAASDIPGSLAYPPLNDQFGPELGKHFVIRTGPTTRVISRGCELRSVTLRGWLHPLPPGFTTNSESGWDDWHYWLDIDTVWAVTQGFDLNSIMRIGNFTDHTRTVVGGKADFFTWAGTAYIHLEINGWKSGNTRGVPQPSGWTFGNSPDFPNVNAGTMWPFDPRFAAGGDLPPYVEVSGSLIADRSHVDGSSPAVHAVGWWRRGISNDAEESPIRAVEIHPTDLITVLPTEPKAEELYGVVLVAASALFDARQQEIDVILRPPGPAPTPAHYAIATEHVGPESYLDTLVFGNARRTGALIEPAGEDGIRVRAAVRSVVWGRLGKFKALYTVRWAVATIPEFAASGFVVFLPPTLLFRFTAPQRQHVEVKIEVQHETGPWRVLVTEDPFNGSDALTGEWHRRSVAANTPARLYAFWLGATTSGVNYMGLDGTYHYRLTMLRSDGQAATVAQTTTVIRWPRIKVTCSSRRREPGGPWRILGLGGPGWSQGTADVIARIEAGAYYFVEQTGREEARVIVATPISGVKYLKTAADGEQPTTLLALPDCSGF